MKRCIETRRTQAGHRRRRYERDDGSRFTTIEVPIEEWARCQRVSARDRAMGVRPQAEALLAQGWKPEAVAFELGVSNTSARRWKQDLHR